MKFNEHRLNGYMLRQSMGLIRNETQILRNGPVRLRQDALRIISEAVQASDPYRAAIESIHREGDHLHIQDLEYDLRDWEHIYVLGAGKATQRIALALEEILGERITDGLIVLKHGEPNQLGLIPVVYASHPIPDCDSLAAGEALLDLARRAGEKDLVISAFTGGSSALAILPAYGISLKDKQALNQLLISSGANIFEINAVRKHVSRIKGGRLAIEIFPAELICLTVSDVVGDDLDFITDLTVPDTSTIQDARKTLDKYQLWGAIPESIRDHLQQISGLETPKTFSHSYHPVLLVPGDAAFQAASRTCQDLGYRTQDLEAMLEGEAQYEAHRLLQTANIFFRSHEAVIPSALVATGETVVRLDSNAGKGGPNQEFALCAALEIQGRGDIIVAAIDMDGSDGPTDAAGAIVDGETVSRGENAGHLAALHLKNHSAYDFLLSSGDLIFSGPTGTNVNDLMFVLIDHKSPVKDAC